MEVSYATRADAFAALARSYWQTAREQAVAASNVPPPSDREHAA